MTRENERTAFDNGVVVGAIGGGIFAAGLAALLTWSIAELQLTPSSVRLRKYGEGNYSRYAIEVISRKGSISSTSSLCADQKKDLHFSMDGDSYHPSSGLYNEATGKND